MECFLRQKAMVWQHSCPEGRAQEQYLTYLGLFVQTYEGGDYEGACWPGMSSWLDYLRPEVRAYWASRFDTTKYQHSTEHLHVWNDMNEPSVFSGPELTLHGCALHGDYEHREVHNVYGQYMHRSTADGLIRRSGGLERPFVLSRSFYAGSQKFGAIWTGDNAAEWSYLKASVPMCLNIALCGLSLCGADVGGFFGTPTPALNARWHQVAAFQPFMRAHSHHDTVRREPWMFGEPHTSHVRQALQVRYSLLAYLYTAFYHYHTTGLPVIRPLFIEFPTLPEFETEGHRYMLGEALYIVPVTENCQREVDVHLPTVPWYDFYSLRQYQAGNHLISVEVDRIPVFIKGGSVIFKQEQVRRSSELMKDDPYSIYVALSSDSKAKGQVFVDDGRTFAYQRGAYLLATLEFDKNTATYNTEGSYAGDNNIDKITIAGLAQPIANAKITSCGESWAVGFYKTAAAVVIKLQNLKMTAQWTLTLELEAQG